MSYTTYKEHAAEHQKINPDAIPRPYRDWNPRSGARMAKKRGRLVSAEGKWDRHTHNTKETINNNTF